MFVSGAGRDCPTMLSQPWTSGARASIAPITVQRSDRRIMELHCNLFGLNPPTLRRAPLFRPLACYGATGRGVCASYEPRESMATPTHSPELAQATADLRD